MRPKINRRQAIKILSISGLALYLSERELAAEPAWAVGSDKTLDQISPIDRSISDIAPRTWFSDYPERAHKVLWDKAGYVNSLGDNAPKPTENVPLVIIGGGISGLFSAYSLRKHKPIILEQAPRFGGNSKGQSWNNIAYSIGAAYIIEPEADSDIGKLLAELGINKLWKIKAGADPVALNGTIFNEFWNGSPAGSDEATKQQILKLASYFKKVNEDKEIKFPDIPVTDSSNLEYIKKLDRESFKAHLERIAEGPLTSLVEAVIEQYCWSSFGAPLSDISAAAGLNFYVAEFGNTAVLPGGNAAAAEQVLKKLLKILPSKNFRASSLVYDVKVTPDGVLVSYQDIDGVAHCIKAQSVVMACPKFVVSKILSDIEQERIDAIRRLRYHSYLVANVCIDGGGKAPLYDLYMLGDGKVNSANIQESSNSRKATDVIYADFAKASAGHTVLTLYRGFPYDGARASLLANDSYEKYRAEFETQIRDDILPLLKIDQKHVKDLRLARWGHPLPVAAPGLIADGIIDIIRKPFKERVFFIEQDNWALPAFETAVTEAQIWAPKVATFLNHK